MSKLSNIAQSAAASLSSESQKLRSTQGAQGKTSVGKPASAKLSLVGGNESAKDSLGNPGSPAYEKFNKTKKEGKEAEPEKKSGIQEFLLPEVTTKTIRINFGWEKLLMMQKKVCEKTLNLITKLDGPYQYALSKRSGKITMKSRGCIVDIDIEEIRQKQELEAKEKKAKQIDGVA